MKYKIFQNLNILKIHVYSTMTNTNQRHIGATICIFIHKLQKILYKTSFIWKSEKDEEITHFPFTK
jgi:hypothetical protein